MKEANIRDGTPDLIGNTSIRGIWQPYTVALLDMRVHRCTVTHTWNTDEVLSSAEEKKRKHNSAAEARRASFTPFVVSTNGMLGKEAKKASPKHKH